MLLYHYTTRNNFLNIVKSNKINLSIFDKPNDFKEKSQRMFDGDSISNYRYFSTCVGEREDGISLLSFANGMMWHHYGDRCRGVCIEFDLNSIINLSHPIKHDRVCYRNGVTHIDNQCILDYLLEKRTCWEGEIEYRFIYKKSTEFINDIQSCIKGIYWGCDAEKVELDIDIPDSIKQYQIYVDSQDGRFNRNELSK